MNATSVRILVEIHLGKDVCHPDKIGMDLWVGGHLKKRKITRFHRAPL
jgi:hypothetical protein